MRKLVVKAQSWPLLNEFKISRGAKTTAEVIVVELHEGKIVGRGECVPYNRYGETVDSVIAQIESMREKIVAYLNNEELNLVMPAGAARNAIDCALWDLKSKMNDTTVTHILDLESVKETTTAQTISLDSPEKMGLDAAKFRQYPILKLKLNNKNVIESVEAVLTAAPEAKLIIDANEAWDIDGLNYYVSKMKAESIALIEQPLPADQDAKLSQYTGSIPLCADESLHTAEDLNTIAQYFHFINIKLDKTGGLSEALRLVQKANEHKMGIMVGCMVGTSLAMAPAFILSSFAQYVDLDGPALMAKDRAHGFHYLNGTMSKINDKLWG